MTSNQEVNQNKSWYVVEVKAFKEAKMKEKQLEENYKNKSPLIAPDGLIPNSIIKKNLIESSRKNEKSLDMNK
jgi:hypothetical protein